MIQNKENRKILLFDIETSPNLGYVWGKWEQNVISFKEYWYMICFSYKWLGEKETYVVALSDFKTYKKDKTDDIELCKKLWELFNQADVIIAHNGDQFDIKKSNARFIKHHFDPPSFYKTIDTKKVAKRYFKFDSNKLDDLGDYFKIGRKLQTGGFDLWLGCIAGNKKSWQIMKDYNKQDTILLEKVYLRMRGWMNNHPNMNLLTGGVYNCPNCNSNQTQKRGYRYTRTGVYQAYQCLSCRSWSQGSNIENKKEAILR